MGAQLAELLPRTTTEEYLERVERWADSVLEESQQLPEEVGEEELRERQVTWYARFYTLEDGGWLIAEPDDPALREWLIAEEGMAPDLADEVLAKMKELAAAR